MCCKIMGVVELNKPANVWCDHCDKGTGCKVYETRPQSCAEFTCAYAGGYMGDDVSARPDKSKVVMGFTNDGSYPVAFVDPTYPNAWRDGAVGRWLKFMVQYLGKAIIVIGHRRYAVGNWTPEEWAHVQNKAPEK